MTFGNVIWCCWCDLYYKFMFRVFSYDSVCIYEHIYITYVLAPLQAFEAAELAKDRGAFFMARVALSQVQI